MQALLGTEGADTCTTSADRAMEDLYRLYGRPIYWFLLRFTAGDQREAEDLLQETLLRAWRQLRDHTLDVGQARPWLYTVARRVAIDAARSRRARPVEARMVDVGRVADPTQEIDRLIIAETVRRGLLQLTPEHRGVLVETYYRGRTAREAAEVLG